MAKFKIEDFFFYRSWPELAQSFVELFPGDYPSKTKKQILVALQNLYHFGYDEGGGKDVW